MWDKELAEKAMQKLIDETNLGTVKWRRWGVTDSEEPVDLDPSGKYTINITFPNWPVYYTKLVGTHVTVEDGQGNQKFCIYWGTPVGFGGSIMDMEKELPLMDELLASIRSSEPEYMSKRRFKWLEENKGKECWWMKQEHIWHTVRDTLDVYLKGEIPNYAGEQK
jgi:hypothetical protein